MNQNAICSNLDCSKVLDAQPLQELQFCECGSLLIDKCTECGRAWDWPKIPEHCQYCGHRLRSKTEHPQFDIRREGVFFAGQTYDAMSAATRIFASAKTRLVLIDAYLGADTLNILPRAGIAVEILTKPPLAAALKTLCQAFKAQYGSLSVKSSPAFHDRFVVIDNASVYHFGASIKDLGKKTFMFSLIEEPEIVAALKTRIATELGNAVVEV